MKWFKHYTDSSDDEFIAGLEEKFGLIGYARWWKLLETIAKQMDKTDRCYAEYSWNKWQTFLKAKRKKLETFLEYSENKLKINLESSDNLLKISCPKLLEIRDNHTKNLQVASKQLTSKNKNKNKNKNKEVDTSTDYETARYILNWRKSLHPNHKDPNLKNWANTIRLMREVDKHSDKEIRELYSWVAKDEFWHRVCLSPDNLRKHWDKIAAKKVGGKKEVLAGKNLKTIENWEAKDGKKGIQDGDANVINDGASKCNGRTARSMVPSTSGSEDW